MLLSLHKGFLSSRPGTKQASSRTAKAVTQEKTFIKPAHHSPLTHKNLILSSGKVRSFYVLSESFSISAYSKFLKSKALLKLFRLKQPTLGQNKSLAVLLIQTCATS